MLVTGYSGRSAFDGAAKAHVASCAGAALGSISRHTCDLCPAQDAVVAKQYISEPETFAATARVWTQNFASQAQADAPDAKVRHVTARLGGRCVCCLTRARLSPAVLLQTPVPSTENAVQATTHPCMREHLRVTVLPLLTGSSGCSGTEAGRDGLR